MSDIVKRLRAMHLETAMGIYCTAANAIEQAEEERDAAMKSLRAMVRWFGKYPEFKPNPDFMEQVVKDIDAARNLVEAADGL
jgi:hypothetical protein